MLLLDRGSINATRFLLLHRRKSRPIWKVRSERCSTSYHRDSVVRAWSVTADAWWPALADCSSQGAVQARRDSPSLSSAPGIKISHWWLLCACVWSSCSFTICRASTVWSTSPPQHRGSRGFDKHVSKCQMTCEIQLFTPNILCINWKHI